MDSRISFIIEFERLPLLLVDPTLCEGTLGDDVKSKKVIASDFKWFQKRFFHNRRSMDIDEVGYRLFDSVSSGSADE
jgi:hypothetical protein